MGRFLQPAIPSRRSRAKRRYHFGVPGFVYVGLTLLIAVGAFNSQNNLLFWTFGLALGVLVVSGLISGAMLMGVDIRREAVSDVSVGDALTIRYRLTNRNRLFPLFALSVYEEHAESREPSLIRRLMSLFAPKRQTPPRRHLSTIATFVNHVAPRSSTSVEARCSALARGPILLSRIRVDSAFPFGLLRKSIEVEQPIEVLVRPLALPFDRLSLLAAAGIGSHSQSARPGPGGEFFSLREFREGDSTRDIAWRATAKRGRAVVKQTSAFAPATLHLDLTFARRPETIEDDERSISTAAGLAVAASRAGIHVSVGESDVGVLVPARAGAHHLPRVLDELARISLEPSLARGVSLHDLPQRATRLSIRAGVIQGLAALSPSPSTVPATPAAHREVAP